MGVSVSELRHGWAGGKPCSLCDGLLAWSDHLMTAGPFAAYVASKGKEGSPNNGHQHPMQTVLLVRVCAAMQSARAVAYDCPRGSSSQGTVSAAKSCHNSCPALPSPLLWPYLCYLSQNCVMVMCM